jgi:hypothetical protein
MDNKNLNQVRKTVGNIFVDIGKLSFGSLLLGSVLKGGFDPIYTFIAGVVLAFIFFIVGVIVISKIKE